MNKDQITGTLEQIAGKIKQGVGEAAGNDKLANEGVADQVKGAAQETWGNLKDGVKEVRTSVRKLPLTRGTRSAGRLAKP